jgi:hypothetical protein
LDSIKSYVSRLIGSAQPAPSPRLQGEGQGEGLGREPPPTNAQAPHPHLLPASGEKEAAGAARGDQTETVSEADYEEEQRQAIGKWRDAPPSVLEEALGVIAAPVAWLLQKIVPAAAIEGALRGADWLAQQTLPHRADATGDGVVNGAGVGDGSANPPQKLSELDETAEGVHRWAVGIAIAEGGAAGAVGLAGIAFDIPALVTLSLRTVRNMGACYGYAGDSEAEREFAFGVLSAAGANSIAEKTAALLFLQQLRTTLLRSTFKNMALIAAEQSLGKEAAIIAVRNLASQLGVNFGKRKMLQAIPLIGAAVGASVNAAFVGDVAWAARRSYQERWLADKRPAS